LIASLNSATDATEAAANIIKYFDLDGNVEDDETDYRSLHGTDHNINAAKTCVSNAMMIPYPKVNSVIK
jgi:hypothetical protein